VIARGVTLHPWVPTANQPGTEHKPTSTAHIVLCCCWCTAFGMPRQVTWYASLAAKDTLTTSAGGRWAFLSGVSEPIGAALAWAVLFRFFDALIYAILFG
jgi:hypothetical protein